MSRGVIDYHKNSASRTSIGGHDRAIQPDPILGFGRNVLARDGKGAQKPLECPAWINIADGIVTEQVDEKHLTRKPLSTQRSARSLDG
jgi:hypothetical protein